jgi:hypothetical protein
MSRKAYTVAFMVLAIMFVPVLFDYFWGALISPCCYAILTIFSDQRIIAELTAFYVAVYLGLFYLLARISFWSSNLFPNRTGKKAVQMLVLVLLFSCSFIRVIQEDVAAPGDNEQTGTYNFWKACARYPASPRH